MKKVIYHQEVSEEESPYTSWRMDKYMNDINAEGVSFAPFGRESFYFDHDSNTGVHYQRNIHEKTTTVTLYGSEGGINDLERKLLALQKISVLQEGKNFKLRLHQDPDDSTMHTQQSA